MSLRGLGSVEPRYHSDMSNPVSRFLNWSHDVGISPAWTKVIIALAILGLVSFVVAFIYYDTHNPCPIDLTSCHAYP